MNFEELSFKEAVKTKEFWSSSLMIGGIFQVIIGIFIGNDEIVMLTLLVIFVSIGLYLKLSVIQDRLQNFSTVSSN